MISTAIFRRAFPIPVISLQGYEPPAYKPPGIQPPVDNNPSAYTRQFIVSSPWHSADPTLTYPTLLYPTLDGVFLWGGMLFGAVYLRQRLKYHGQLQTNPSDVQKNSLRWVT